MHQKGTPAPRFPLVRQGASLPAPGPNLTLALAVALALGLGGCATGPWGKRGENIRGGYAAGDKVAVILPTKGPIAEVADAVREGVRAAQGADDTATKPALSFVEGDQPAKAAEVLAEAVKGGTTHAIGPLQKPAVDALAGGPALKIPTLALNRATLAAKPAANLYQFALAPETEAIEAANKAQAAGFKRALMLYPAGDVGKRRADAFRGQWKRLGGTLAGEQSFDPAGKDPAGAVKKLLANQADFLFLSANATQARQLYPLVHKGAAGLTVIATSEVYPGDADRARDKDLAGLYFVDLPWVLGVGADQDPLARSRLRSGAHYLSTPLGLRLYAMGIDAYRLAPRLAALAKEPGATFPGETGTISLDPQGQVERRLALGRYTENGPRAVAEIGAEPTAAAAPPAAEPGGAGKAQPTAPTEPQAKPVKPKPEPRRPAA